MTGRSSSSRSAASRRNGALSRGPRTQAGKEKAKMNARRHGLSNRTLPDNARAAVEVLAAALQAEGVERATATVVAEAYLRVQQVNEAVEAELAAQLELVDHDKPFEEREALAYLAALERLGPLMDHEDRAAGRLLKTLRRARRT